ncbi:uncharacterized protein [Dermacentor andersoni]|uniref:uncharacterized protein n=1 Tax=Dermacentor andersoni TaxID=34620 RepID=UPI002417B6F9|nr:uncharacterized protein LOC129382926 [Dermacentor andersoni]
MRSILAVASVTLFCVMAVDTTEVPVTNLPPELRLYQDSEKCAVVQEAWYMTYTSVDLFELHSNATCWRFTVVTALPNGATLSLLQYEPNGTSYVLSRHESTGNRHSKQVIYARHLPDGDLHKFQVLYNDCDTCKVYATENFKKEKGCMLYIAERVLEKENAHCHFIFDLLCGPSYKYRRSDASCLIAHRSRPSL